MRSNYAGQPYLLSPGGGAVPAAVGQHLSGLTLAGQTAAAANGRIRQQQQQVAAATVAAAAAGANYPSSPPAATGTPTMASNKLESAPGPAPAPAQVRYHNGSGGINGFKAALRHPQKFIHNLYSGAASKSAQQQQQQQVLSRAAEDQQRQQLFDGHRPQVSRFPGEAPKDAHHLEAHRQEQYASQLRSSPLLQRFQHQHQQHQPPQQHLLLHQHHHHQMHPAPAGHQQVQASPVSGRIAEPGASSPAPQADRQQQPTRPGQQVNFNRGAEQLEEPGESRKKKYLTAKYGQQQMSLIKKRLKIEMWLYEQLQELAKSTKSEAELDEIEIDLDQLLDMDDDETRRAWLKKTLEPFEDLQPERIDKFINDVLDQSKLL